MKRFLLISLSVLLLLGLSNDLSAINFMEKNSDEIIPGKSESRAPFTVVIDFSEPDDVLCPNVGDITFTAIVTGGSGTFTYQWWGLPNDFDPGDVETFTLEIDTGMCNNEINITLQVFDDEGDHADDQLTLLFIDDEAPEITGTLDDYIVYGCDADDYPPVETIAELVAMGLTITDNCTVEEDEFIITSEDQVTNPCPLEVTRTYYIKDACNNAAEISQLLTINKPPFSIYEPAGYDTVECVTDIVEPTPPIVFDECEIEIIPTVSSYYNPDPFICHGEKIFEFTYTDCAGNDAVWTFVWVIKPTFTVTNPEPVVVNCLEDTETAPIIPPIANSCGIYITEISEPVITYNPDPLSCNGEVIYTYTLTDCAENTADWVFTYIVEMPALVITAPPGEAEVSCPSEIPSVDQLLLLVPDDITDYCGNPIQNVILQHTESIPSEECEQQRIFTFRFEDCNGQSDEWTLVYNITRGPFTTPIIEPYIVECIDDIFEPTDFPPVIDACGVVINDFVLTGIEDNPSPLTCNGTRTYLYTYTDCSGNTAVLEYVFQIDIPPPVVPEDDYTTINCQNYALPTDIPLPEVNDNCGNPIIPTLHDEYTIPENLTCEGEYVFEYKYHICEDIYEIWTYTFYIEPELILTAENVFDTISCVSDLAPPSDAFIPTAVDGCWNLITYSDVSITPIPDPLTCEGQQVYTYEYESCDGNTTLYWDYTLVVILPDAITFSIPYGEDSVDCFNNAIHPTQDQLPEVTDACGNIIDGFLDGFEDFPDPEICGGTRVYTYKYIDCAGHDTTWIFTYTIRPTLDNVISPEPVYIDCPDEADEPDLPVIFNSCGMRVEDITGPVIEPTEPLTCDGEITYTYTLTDCGGDVGYWVYTYIVEVPELIIQYEPGIDTVECPGDIPIDEEIFLLSPKDIVDACGNPIADPELLDFESFPSLDCELERVYTFEYTDCKGEHAYWTHTFHIERPPFTLDIQDSIADVNCPNYINIPPNSLPIARDYCGDTLNPPELTGGPIYDPPHLYDSLLCAGTAEYIYTFTDCRGETTEWSFIYNVGATVPPIVPPNIVDTVTNIAQAILPSEPIIYDVCNNVLEPLSIDTLDVPFPLICEGTRTFLFVYEDCGNNQSVWEYTYVLKPEELFLEVIDFQHFCTYGNDGSITLEASGGAAPYIYNCVNQTTGEAISSEPIHYTTYTFEDLFAGTYYVYVEDVNKCTPDEATTIIIEMHHGYPPVDRVLNACKNELPITYEHLIIEEEGIYELSMNTLHGCDSVVLLTVNIFDNWHTQEEATLCANELPYEWRGKFLTETGIYKDHYFSEINACDSIYELDLTVIDTLSSIGEIDGATECVYSPDVAYGEFIYTIEPVENVLYYEWKIEGAPWHIEHDFGTVCTLYVRTRDVGILSVQAFSDCGISEVSTIRMNAMVGIENIDGMNVGIYPNPASEFIIIQFENFRGNTDISIYDISGKLIDTNEVNIDSDIENIKYDINMYRNGIYFIKIRNKKTSITERIIIQH